MNNNCGRNYTPNHNVYNQQTMGDQIDYQIHQLQQMKEQMKNNQQFTQQPTNFTQNFQIAPTNREIIKYANTIEEVQRDMVAGDTPYFSKDMSVVWIKNTKGDIKTYELNEIIPKDEKDFEIELLKAKVNELEGMIKNESNATNVNAEQITTNTTTTNEPIGESIEKSKSTSLSRVSTSKKK